MPLLPHAQVLRLHAAVVSGGMTSSRATLFAGIDRGLRDHLPVASSLSEQILSDLHELNVCGQLSGGGVPLQTWLENAVQRLRGAWGSCSGLRRAPASRIGGSRARSACGEAVEPSRGDTSMTVAVDKPVRIILLFR